MSKTVASADITLLDFSVLFDLSTALPTVKISNLSTVVNEANLQWIFELTNPGGYPIHLGTFDTPDIDGIEFDDYTIPEAIPLLFKQVEYSKTAKYTVTVSVKDALGNVFSLSKGQPLCKPNGNAGKNNFGAANIQILTKCASGQLLVTDKTDLLYKGIEGTKVSTTVKLSYPKDDEGNSFTIPTVTVLPCLLPIKREGEGHEIYVAHVFDYDLGDYFNVRVRYSFKDTFAVWCNMTLQPLFCAIDPLVETLSKTCNDSEQRRESMRTLLIANAKMIKAHTGMVEPLSGIDVPKIIEEIKDLLEVTCDCCLPAGISNVGTALATDAIFTAEKVCGDMLLEWENDGMGNITLKYQNVTRTFIISDDTDSEAFSYVETVAGCNKQLALKVSIPVLAEELVNEIATNQTLINLINSIVQSSQLVCSGLDGMGVLTLDSCNYSIQLSTSNAITLFTGVQIAGNEYTAPTDTLLTNYTAIQTWLNTLGLGTFVVVYDSEAKTLTITTAANTNTVSLAHTSTSGVTKSQLFSSDCGMICTILQRLIVYMSTLNMLQIKSGQALTICRFNTDGTVLTKDFADTVTAAVIAKYMADSFCNVVNYIKDKLISCDNLKLAFATATGSTGNPKPTDTVAGFMEGKCQQIPVKNLALSIFGLLSSDADVKSMYCQGGKCDTVDDCSPVTDLAGVIGDTSGTFTWTAVASAIGYKWSINGTTWFNVGSTNAFVSGLTADSAYTFRVYPVYNSGDGTPCTETLDFVTTNAGAGCEAPGNLVLSAVTSSSFNAAWDAVAGATGYQYRVNGGSWISPGLVLNVDVTGLTEDTLYNFEVRAIIGGTPCAETATDSVTTEEVLVENLHVFNIVSGMSITVVDEVGGDPIFAVTSGALPLAEGESLAGVHGDFDGEIQVTVTGTFAASYALLKINGADVECIDIPSAGAYNFTTAFYTTSQAIEIYLQVGTCT